MDKRKKLPLPAGKSSAKYKTRLAYATVASLLIIGFVFLFYQKSSHPREFTSSKAFFDGSFIEVQVLTPGVISYIAPAGQMLNEGDLVLKIDSTEYEQATKEAEEIVEKKAGTISPAARNLMLRYLSIPENTAQLNELIQGARKVENALKEELSALSERQASFRLELRQLELQHNKLAGEENRMDAMRVEEYLIEKNMVEANKKFELASLSRASLENKLQLKKDLERALQALPSAQRAQLLALETEFKKMHKAQLLIEQSNLTSPVAGLVLSTKLTVDNVAGTGETALYILPNTDQNIWVRAYFKEAQAVHIKSGAQCIITFQNDHDGENINIEGQIAELLPYIKKSGETDIPFKITLPASEHKKLIGIQPQQNVKVTLINS